MNMTNTPTYIYKELKKRGIKTEIISEEHSLMSYRHKGSWKMLRGCVTKDLSAISRYICEQKDLAEIYAKEVGMPVPASQRYQTTSQAIKFIEKYGKVVTKPVSGAQGKGITIGVSSKTELKKALTRAGKISDEPPIMQQLVAGKDVRILIIGGKYTAAVRRVPASVTGDGQSTIAALIDKENKSSKRASGKRGRLKVINFEAAKAYLKRRVGRVPKKGEIVPVVGMGNTSLGGHGEDFTEQLPAKIYKKAEKFASLLELPVCGIDIMLEDDGNYHFIEANASPGFGPHHHPRFGKNRRVVEPFVDMLLG